MISACVLISFMLTCSLMIFLSLLLLGLCGVCSPVVVLWSVCEVVVVPYVVSAVFAVTVKM